MIKYIQAEFIKLRYPPILWLTGATVMSISLLIFFAHYNDVESVAVLGKNPWIKLWNAAIGIFSVFMKIPFLVLLISAAIFIESHNNTWKYQYCAPVSRIKILSFKLLSILIIVVFTYLLLAIGMFGVAYFLNFFLPETEFAYYSIHFSTYTSASLYTLINSLGIIGLQFFLSVRFKGFLVPAVIGIVAFIIGLIVGITNTPVSHYFPYAYPLIGQDFNMFTIDNIGIVDWEWINSIQICSIATFLIFISLGVLSENRRFV